MSVYPPPNYTETLTLFNPINWLSVNTSDETKLDYPVAQGAETLLNTTITGTLTLTNTSPPTSTATQPASTDSSTKIPTTAWVQSAISGGGVNSFTLTSSAVGTNVWNITIPNSYGRAFNYALYTDIQPTTSSKTGLGSSGTITYGVPTANGSFCFQTGSMIYQPYSGTSSTMITYCAGFQQQYTISAGGGAYIPSVNSSLGQYITISLSSNSVSENANCPPTASSGFTTIYTFSIPNPVASCYLKLVGIVIAS